MINNPPIETAFAEQLQRLDAMRLFMASLPMLSLELGRTIHLEFEARPEGVACSLGFAGADEKDFPQFSSRVMDRLTATERLQRLQLLVDEFRNVGVSTEILDPMIADAEAQAMALYPRAHRPD